MEERKESSLKRFMVSEDTVPLETPIDKGNDRIVTDHAYFTERPSETFLDEDAAVNVNNSEMTATPNEYE